MHRRIATLILLLPGCPFIEPEVGRPCDDNPARVAELIVPEPGFDALVQDVTLRNCTQGLCASTDGSRPYCTIFCDVDRQCPTDEGFACRDAAPLDDSAATVCVGSPDIIAARDDLMGR